VKMSFKDAIVELKSLKSAVDAAEYKLFRFAFEVEQDGCWREPGAWATFDDLLKKEHICEPHRYRNFLAFEKLYPGKVEEIGTPAAVEAMKISDPTKREKLIQTAEVRFRTEGVPFSYEQISNHRKTIDPPPSQDTKWNERVNNEARQLEDLKKENIKLKQDIFGLKQENKKLRKENVELQDKVDELQKKPKKTKETRV